MWLSNLGLSICFFSIKTIKFTMEDWFWFFSPNFNDLFWQQKAKETPKKAKQPTETFNLSLWWRCRHVKYNLSWQQPVSAFWLCSRYPEATKLFKLCGLKCIVPFLKIIIKKRVKTAVPLEISRQYHLHRNHQPWEV